MAGGKWLLILNGKQSGNEAVREAVRLFREKGQDVDVRVTWEEGDARRFVKLAVEESYESLIAGGGDGTLREVADTLARMNSDIGLALMPLGTANDFARSAQIPEEPAEALALAQQPAVPVDLIEMNGHLFMNMASGGFGAKVTAQTSETLKKVFGGMAYMLTGLKQIKDLKPMNGRFSAQDYEWEGPFLIVSVGNGRQAGSGNVLCPQAHIDDGVLDFSILPAPEGFVDAINEVWSDEIGLDSMYLRGRSPWLTIRLDEPMDVNLDGEPICERCLTFEVQPAAIRMHLPPKCPLLGSSSNESA